MADAVDARFQEMQLRADRVLATTSPIFAQAQDGGIEGVGTGIFFRYQDRHFVLNAATCAEPQPE